MATDFPKLSAPAHRALDSAGYDHLEDLARTNRKDVAKMHGMGPNALGKLDAALRAAGLRWADSKSD